MAGECMIDLRTEGETVLAVASGDQTVEQAPTLRAALMKALEGRASSVVLDLGHVPRVDSSVIAVCLEVLDAARARGIAFALANVGMQARRVIGLARLEDVLPFADQGSDADDRAEAPA